MGIEKTIQWEGALEEAYVNRDCTMCISKISTRKPAHEAYCKQTYVKRQTK